MMMTRRPQWRLMKSKAHVVEMWRNCLKVKEAAFDLSYDRKSLSKVLQSFFTDILRLYTQWATMPRLLTTVQLSQYSLITTR